MVIGGYYIEFSRKEKNIMKENTIMKITFGRRLTNEEFDLIG